MRIGTVEFTTKLSVGRAIGNALRRRIWRWLFAPNLRALDSFFLDARDHIGAERIIMGDRFEGQLLSALDAILRKLELGDGCAIDVGANIGNHACFFAQRFRQVICIEPGGIAALVLKANLEAASLTNFQIHRCALGNADRAGVLDRINDENLGSSIVREVAGAGDFPILPGDQIWRSTGLSQLQLVKIDVEGAEVEAIEGLLSTIANEKPLICVEVLDAQRWAKVKALLGTAGYTAWYVLVPKSDSLNVVGRILSMLRGKRMHLVPMSPAFKQNGYEMILCMTSSHVSRLLG